MNFEIRTMMASPNESIIVGELVSSLLIELYPQQSHLYPIEKMITAASELLIPGSGVWSFLAMQGNLTIGMLNLNECSTINAGGKFGEITELYIKPEFRSKKIGEKLLSQAKDFSRSRGWKKLEVSAPDVPRCQRTVSFYQKNGFSDIGLRLELEI